MSDQASKPSGCFEVRSFGHGARFQVTPEGNQQLTSQGDNTDLAQTDVALSKAPLIPLTELAFGLGPQPTPGNFNGHGSDKSVSGLFDTLIFAGISALIGCVGQARTGADFPAVAKSRQLKIVAYRLPHRRHKFQLVYFQMTHKLSDCRLAPKMVT